MVVALGLVLVAVLTRAPFVTHHVATWDSANFALALRRFDMGNSQPHAPGYFFYLALGYLVVGVAGSPNAALVAVSVLATGAAAALTYAAGRIAADHLTGLVGALVILASPVAWFYSDVALSYTAGMAAAAGLLAAAALAWRDGRWLWLLFLAAGLGGGVRQELMIYQAPLVLLVTAHTVRSGKLVAVPVAALAGAVGVAAWLGPLLLLTGGLEQYLAMVKAISATTVASGSAYLHPSLLPGHLVHMAEALVLSLGGFILAPALLLRHAARRRRVPLIGALAVLVPGVAWYTLGLFDRVGYVLMLLPSLALLAAIPVATLLQAENGRARRLVAAGTGAAAVLGAGYFLLWPGQDYPQSLLGNRDVAYSSIPTAATLRSVDDTWSRIAAVTRAQGGPTDVVVVSTSGATYNDWRDAVVVLDPYPVGFVNLGNPDGIAFVRCDHFVMLPGTVLPTGPARHLVLVGEGAGDTATVPGGDRRWHPAGRDIAVADLQPGDPPIQLGGAGAFQVAAGGAGPPACPSQ